MEFRSVLNIPESVVKIHHSSRIMTIGSCFSEHIGHKMQQRKFPIHIHPFGTVFNPHSMVLQLRRIVDSMPFTTDDLIFHHELWHTWEHSRHFTATNKESLLEQINSQLKVSHDFIQKTDFLMITFGTAWAYFLQSNQQIVANCHKHPASAFGRQLLSVEQLSNDFFAVFELLTKLNPSLQILLTVSPVRHLRDGLIQDRWSKSRLIDLAHTLENSRENVHYFPAYEIFTDELREYRFCEADLTHPSSIAIEYIWQQFQKTYFSESTQKINKEIERILAAMQHNVQHQNTTSFKQFAQQQYERVQNFQQNYPELNMGKESEYWSAFNKRVNENT